MNTVNSFILNILLLINFSETCGQGIDPNRLPNTNSKITSEPGYFGFTVVHGNLDVLSDQNIVNVEFDYSLLEINTELSLSNGKGKKKQTDSLYILNRMDHYEKKRSGDGAQWREKWLNARQQFFEPAFLEELNDALINHNLTANRSNDGAKYTLLVDVEEINPGFNKALSNESWVSFNYYLIESSNRVNRIATIWDHHVTGGHLGSDFETSERISKAFSKSGKKLGKYIAKLISSK